MAIKLSAAYSKKAGLPGYSSHSFSVSIETELQNLDNVREESARLYDSLQEALDQNALDRLAAEMFGAKLQALNKLQASGFIDELLDRYGKRTQQSGRYPRR